MPFRRLGGWGINLRLIKSIKGKMIHKWVVLNLLITFIIIFIVGFSIKEFACYQFNVYSNSSSQSEQFRAVIETYLLYASIIAFSLAIIIHLFFARRILQPLGKLTYFSNRMPELRSLKMKSKDEVGQIANDLIQISKQVHGLQEQNDQMMADIAHELRTPLTTLHGYIEGLEDGMFSQDENTTAILKRECERLITFIERIHTLHEWEQKELSYGAHQIESLVQSVVNDFSEEGLRIQVNVQAERITCDASAIRTIMQELLANAVHYDKEQDITIEGNMYDERYIVFISNRGDTFSKQDRERLFERFYRVDSSRSRHTGGAGLGLAIAQEIVSKIEGEIGYEMKDKLHTFWFSIPIKT